MNQDKPFVWKSHWKQTGWAQIWVGHIAEITKAVGGGWETARLMECQIWYPPAGSWFCGESAQKWNNDHCQHFGRSLPPSS